MKNILRYISFALMTAIGVALANPVVAQTPDDEQTIPAILPGSEKLQSAAERSMDWLNKQISPPSDDAAAAGGLRLFSDPDTKRSAIKTGATLALLLSLFLLMVFVWKLRPGSKTRNKRRAGNEVVSVLGQIPFVHGQQLQLVRLGTRLLLVAASPSGSQTLSEISDPQEVLQLESAFRQGRMDLLTASMQQRAVQTPQNGISLGSHQQTGRTLLEA